MPESTCLHIQDQESGPIRVVDIPWISVRIGRAAFCEVRLTADDLADEACRLYRRGSTWHLVPAGSRGKIVIDGRSIEAACLLPFDVPFRVGNHYLTLRQDRTVDPDWQMYPGPVAADPKRTPPPSKRVRPELNDAGRATPIVESARVVEASFQPDWRPQGPGSERESAVDHAAAGASVKDRWQTRWRAAGAELEARNERRSAGRDDPRPTYSAGFDSVPLKQAPLPRSQPRETPVTKERPATRTQPRETPDPGVARLRGAGPKERPFPEEVPIFRPQPVETPAPEKAPVSAGEQRLEPTGPAAATLTVGAASSAPAAIKEAEVATETVELESSAPTAVEKAEDAACWIEPEPEAESQFESTELETIGLFDQIEPVPADCMIAEPPAPTAIEIETEPDAPGDDTSWYEIPVLAPAPQKRRDRPRAGSRKTTAREPRYSSADTDTAGATAAAARRREKAGVPKPAAVRTRADHERQPFAMPESVPDPSPRSTQMPSARDILATHETRRRAQPAKTPASRSRPALGPTLAREPDQWAISAWVAGPPAAALVVIVGLAGGILSWWWASDSHAVALMSERLIAADQSGRRRPLPDSVAPPDGSWTRTTAQHLANWAIFMSFVEPGKEPTPEDVRALSSRALEISPLNPTARLTRAQFEPIAGDKTISPHGLGLSRDAASLAWCARRLLEAGNKEGALNMYLHALRLLAPAEPFRARMPRFCDDQNTPRYLLPGEERLREILREMLSKSEWEVSEWTGSLPKDEATTLAAARLFKEHGKHQANDLLESVTTAPLPPERGDPASAVALAARAEAFALRSQWKEAAQNYRLAIDLVDDDKIKRSWWFNLADIELQLQDETQWQSALRAALAVSPADEISRRATDVQRLNSGRTVGRATSARAN
jgi:tetratricopeptide (TPR) repeat protein